MKECLGSDRDWGLVSLMDKEGEKRMDSIARYGGAQSERNITSTLLLGC